MDSNYNTTCGYHGCAKPGDILIGYWVFEDNRCRPFRLEGNHISCESHAPDVAAEAYAEKLIPDSAASESLVVVGNRVSPNKVLVYRLGEDSFMNVPQSHVQEKVYEKLKMKLTA